MNERIQTRIRFIGDNRAWEDIRTHPPYRSVEKTLFDVAQRIYMTMRNSGALYNDMPIHTQIKEIRINYEHSQQGYYFTPKQLTD